MVGILLISSLITGKNMSEKCIDPDVNCICPFSPAITMVSKQEDKINFGKLETEVFNAMNADAKYQRENDAKFRAVDQKVATYDEFV